MANLKDETTRPDTLKAIFNACERTREAAVTAANASLETKADVAKLGLRMTALEARVTRLENLQGLVPFAALAFSLGALVIAALK